MGEKMNTEGAGEKNGKKREKGKRKKEKNWLKNAYLRVKNSQRVGGKK